MVLGAVLWSAPPLRLACPPEHIHHPSFCCFSSSTAGTSRIRISFLRGSTGDAAATSSSSVVAYQGGRGRPTVVFRQKKKRASWACGLPRASVGSAEYTVEPTTDVKFQNDLQVSGCSSSLSLLGTGYREKVFAIIKVKVYAAGFYVNQSIAEVLGDWKGRLATQILDDSSLFNSIFQGIKSLDLFLLKNNSILILLSTTDSKEKSLQIVLVRDVDGETFWNALNDVISPRIKEPSSTDEAALSTFHRTFEGRPLKQGTIILLTWVEPCKMLVSISSDGLPSTIDAEIESINVTSALFDAYFGPSPVSPTLKASVANGLTTLLDH